MFKSGYFGGFLKHFFCLRVSKLALIDSVSFIHPKAKIYRFVKLFHSRVDAYSYITPGTELVFANIGKFCSIGRNCLIGLPIHPIKFLSTSPIFISKYNALGFKWTDYSDFNEFKEVYIGNDVWIGSRVIIQGGVKIGNGAVIGAGSIVTKDIPDFAVAVGVPARVIKFRFDEILISKINHSRWWDYSDTFLRSNIREFQKEQFDLNF